MRQEYAVSILQEIVSQYAGLGNVLSAQLFTSGYENTNYLVTTSAQQKVVVKIFEGLGMQPQNIFFELEVMVAMPAAGRKVPLVWQAKSGKYYVQIGEKYAIVMERAEGENMSGKELSDTLMVEMAEEVARLDIALKIFPNGAFTRQNYEWDLKNFLQLVPKMRLLPKKFDRQVFAEIFKQFGSIEPVFLRQPTGLIHNDVGTHNILAKDGHLTAVIDFSDLAFSPYVQNIAVSLAQAAFFRGRAEQAALFVSAYQAIHPLPKSSLELLYDLILARVATWMLELNDWNIRFGEDAQRLRSVDEGYECLQRILGFGRGAFNKLLPI